MKLLSRKYLKSSDGGMAINFGLGITALLIGVGAAIDISLMTSQKSKLQDVADATALAAAMSGEIEQNVLQNYSEKFVKSSKVPDVDVAVKLNDGNVLVELTQSTDLMFSEILNTKLSDLFADSEVPLPGSSSGGNGGNNYNVALVLDATSSMLGDRMDALKIAATNFLTSMDEQASDESMVSLVPFSNYVRLPVSYADETWMELATTSVEPDDYYSTETWEGCVNSRQDGFHTEVDFEGRRFHGFFEGDRCGVAFNNELIPLSRDYISLKTDINSWIPNGATYLPSGLAWGWRTLSPNAPLEEAKENPDGTNVLIFMSDGSNTLNIGGGEYKFRKDHTKGQYHIGQPKSADRRAGADATTTALCEGIKADGIRIITLAFEVYNEETLNLLETCASSPSDFYLASDGNDLLESFENIEEDLHESENVVRLVR